MPPHIPRVLPMALAALALLALALPAAQAGNSVYRWKDKDGNVHYSDHGGSPYARRVPVPEVDADPLSLAELEIVRVGDASEVYVNNKLGGPLQIDLGL